MLESGARAGVGIEVEVLGGGTKAEVWTEMSGGGTKAGVRLEGEVLGGGIRAGVEIIHKFAALVCPPCLLGGGSNRSPNSCSSESAGYTSSGCVQHWFMEHALQHCLVLPLLASLSFSRANTKGSEGALSPQSLCHSRWFWREKKHVSICHLFPFLFPSQK